MSTATEMWDQEIERERAMATAISLAEHAIVMEAETLCVLLKDDPCMVRMQRLLDERRAKTAAYMAQIPRTTQAMKAACMPFTMEESDVH